MNSIKYEIANLIFKIIPNDLIPRNKWGDKIWSLRKFLRVHKRLPSNKLIFNDVLFNIKTSDEITDPLRVFTTDKEFSKLYVKAVVGETYIIPTYSVLHSVNDIDSYQFPDKCCIKPTQGCGKVIIRKNGESININEIKAWFNINYYNPGRERNYQSLKPKVIVEELIFDGEPIDYKIFCFNGKPRMIQVDFDRYIDHSRKLYDIDWNELDYCSKSKIKLGEREKPKNIHELIEISEKLSANFSFVRIDLYTDGSKIFVGEITHCSGNALEAFYPINGEIEASKLIFGNN
jgi:hypothetical protein